MAHRIVNATSEKRCFKKKSLRVATPVSCFFNFWFRFRFIILILFACGDTELNPDLKKRNYCYNFSICHWNLNSINTHNFAKRNLLQAYNAIHDFDMICLFKLYLDSSISSNNYNLYIKDYKLVRVDHPGNVKRGGVFVFILHNLYLQDVYLLPT